MKAIVLRWIAIVSALICIVIILPIINDIFLNSTSIRSSNLAVNLDSAVPAQIQNAHLHIVVSESPTHEEGFSASISLKNPFARGSDESDTNIYSDEERLVAIKTNGFQILFTKSDYPILQTNGSRILQREKGYMQTNIILFLYGKVTETNALGWRIVGKFK